MSTDLADVGFIGLSSQSKDLILNMNDKGFSVAVYSRNWARAEDFLATEAQGTNIRAITSLSEFVSQLKTPRKIFLKVMVGHAVDHFILQIREYLDPSDILIDLANSNYLDTARRTRELEERGLYFVGCGVGGGLEAARTGPCLSPGGSPYAWPAVQAILQSMAAQVDGRPCCDWIAGGGAGHFVKTMQTGILHSNMQLLAEAYEMLRRVLGLTEDEIAEIFATWNRGLLESALLNLTVDILKFKDDDGEAMVTKIMDRAGTKGAAKWAAVEALEHDVCFPITTQAVFCRYLSWLKEDRVRASRIFGDPPMETFSGDKQAFVNDLEQAVYASQVMLYCQTFGVMAAVPKNQWTFNFQTIAHIWRGCLIAGDILIHIGEAYKRTPQLEALIHHNFFRQAIERAQPGWRRSVSEAVIRGVSVQCLSAALAYLDGYRSAVLPANLVQALDTCAQRGRVA
ncbi:6-phosphogluconate dehydrogenase [Mycena albidolilacea]|uniref:6-phosphogluconate dehydrogenase, decarboxylating n=1 Tax=Mycena albidolilacea TaxID=1033008 RepID=A0AAD6ZAV0_9AGAR|nr:6-phosphogluconate dehydrogenase [Mycena albidolilacea]